VKLAIMEPISNETVNKVIEEILICRANRRDPNIFLYVNSPGGDVDAGYAIYEALRLSGKRIISYAVNHVYSCAVLVYLVGDMRFANNYSNFMIHEPYHELGDDKMNFKAYQRNIGELTECIDGFFKLICDRTELTPAKIKRYLQKAPEGEWYFKSDLAKKIGIVHEIGMP
jgi:ATP-dependent Clp protease protease subunit